MRQACEKFASALYEFLSAINSQDVRVAAVSQCAEETEEKEDTPAAPVKEKKERGSKFPKKYSDWAKDRTDVFANVCAIEWNRNKIQFMVTPAQEDAVNDLIGEVVDELRNLSGNKGIDVITKVLEVKPVPPPAPKAVEAPKKEQSVTADQVKSACVACALKLKDKAKVRVILEEVGGTARVDDMDPSKFVAVWNALKQATEVSPLQSADESGW